MKSLDASRYNNRLLSHFPAARINFADGKNYCNAFETIAKPSGRVVNQRADPKLTPRQRARHLSYVEDDEQLHGDLQTAGELTSQRWRFPARREPSNGTRTFEYMVSSSPASTWARATG